MFVVAGVPGKTGAATANALLAKGEPVRVIVRNAAKGEPWRARGAQVAIAELEDHAAVVAALRGAKGAYLLNPPDYTSSDPVGKAQRVGASFARAIEESGLAHAVVLSSYGAHLSAGTGIIASTRALERELAKHSARITFLRAAAFMQNQASVAELARSQGILPSMLQPLDHPFEMVDTTEIGRVAAETLLAGASGSPRVIELTGPHPYSLNDVAAIFSRLYARTVQPVAPPREQWAGILLQGGMSQAVADLFTQMFDGINNGVVAFEHPESVMRSHGTLETALARDFGTAAAPSAAG